MARNVHIKDYKHCQSCASYEHNELGEVVKRPIEIRALWVVPINKGHRVFKPNDDGGSDIVRNNALFLCSQCFEKRGYDAKSDNVAAITFIKPRLVV